MSAAVQPEIRLQIWDRFRDCPPRNGDQHAWAAEVGKEVGLAESTVLRIVREESDRYLDTYRQTAMTEAQAAANALGLTIWKSLQTLNEQLSATKKRPLLDGKGRPVLKVQNGEYTPENIVFIEVPDNQARNQAIVTALKVQGGFAPEKIEVDHRKVNINLTPEQSQQMLEEIERRNAILRQYFAGKSPTTIAVAAGSGADDGSDRAEGRLLLAHELHEDERRAG